jgi:hypothetical protein
MIAGGTATILQPRLSRRSTATDLRHVGGGRGFTLIAQMTWGKGGFCSICSFSVVIPCLGCGCLGKQGGGRVSSPSTGPPDQHSYFKYCTILFSSTDAVSVCTRASYKCLGRFTFKYFQNTVMDYQFDIGHILWIKLPNPILK